MLHTFNTAGGCGCTVTWDTRETWVRVQYCERHKERPVYAVSAASSVGAAKVFEQAFMRAQQAAERKQ